MLRVLGPGDYSINSDRLSEEPTGEVLDALEAWTNTQMERFVSQRDMLCSTYNAEKGL